MLDGVPAFVPENLHAFSVRSAFDLEQLGPLEAHEPGVGEVEGNGDSWDAAWGEPFVGQPGVGPDGEPPCLQFPKQLLDILFEPTSLDPEIEVLEAKLQEAHRGPPGPRAGHTLGGFGGF